MKTSLKTAQNTLQQMKTSKNNTRLRCTLHLSEGMCNYTEKQKKNIITNRAPSLQQMLHVFMLNGKQAGVCVITTVPEERRAKRERESFR